LVPQPQECCLRKLWRANKAPLTDGTRVSGKRGKSVEFLLLGGRIRSPESIRSGNSAQNSDQLPGLHNQCKTFANKWLLLPRCGGTGHAC
jgi:hypothetical protein